MRDWVAAHNGVERRLVGHEAWLHDVERLTVDREARRLELEQRLRGGVGEPGVLPDPCREADHRSLVGLELDLGQLEGVALDPVADLVVEVGVEVADLDRDSERAELVLVALEHLLERLVGPAAVVVDHVADPVLGHEAA